MSTGVLYSSELGVYLGSCMGLGFWSNLDPAGQPSAVVFPNKEKAFEFANTWESPVEDLKFQELIPDEGLFASIDCCVRAGLPKWNAYDGIKS